MRRFPLMLAVLSALTACASLVGAGHLGASDPSVWVTAAMKNPRVKLPKICSRGVALHSTFDKIPAGYQEIALLTASADWDGVSNTTLYQAQLKEAARLGANAIIVESLREASTLGKLVELRTGWIPQRQSSATAIYISADSQRVRLACSAKK